MRHRRARRIDANQPAIVKALRDAGCSVEVLSDVGGGVPDLLVACRGRISLLEVKDPAQPPSKRKLTPDEAAWHAWFQGPVYVVLTPQEAVNAACGKSAPCPPVTTSNAN